MKKMEDNSVDLVLTDPPYGINFSPQRKNAKEKFGVIDNDEKQGKDWVEWFEPICKETYRILKDDSVAYFFCGFNPYYYYSVLQSCGFEIKANIIWVKDNFGLGYHFRRQYEQVLVGFKGKPPTPEKAMSDVIFADKVLGAKLVHSCQKPVDLCQKLIEQYSIPSNLVFDPFMGSGTTGVAALKLKRNFLGIEIDSNYFEIAKKRIGEWENQSRLF